MSAAGGAIWLAGNGTIIICLIPRIECDLKIGLRLGEMSRWRIKGDARAANALIQSFVPENHCVGRYLRS